MSLKTVMSDMLMEMDTPDGVVSRMEMTGGSPPGEIDISRGPDMLQISVTATEIAGGSPPADIDIYVVPDMLQTDISMTTTEMAGGSPPAALDICIISDVLPIAMFRENSDVRYVDGDGYSGCIQIGSGRWKSSG